MNVKRGRITTTSWPNYVALAEVMIVLTLDKWTINFMGDVKNVWQENPNKN